jgi:hypothetical protein
MADTPKQSVNLVTAVLATLDKSDSKELSAFSLEYYLGSGLDEALKWSVQQGLLTFANDKYSLGPNARDYLDGKLKLEVPSYRNIEVRLTGHEVNAIRIFKGGTNYEPSVRNPLKSSEIARAKRFS